MKHYVIVEYQNNRFNSVRGPYTNEEDAYNHMLKCEEYRKKHPIPIDVTWQVNLVYNPDYLG